MRVFEFFLVIRIVTFVATSSPHFLPSLTHFPNTINLVTTSGIFERSRSRGDAIRKIASTSGAVLIPTLSKGRYGSTTKYSIVNEETTTRPLAAVLRLFSKDSLLPETTRKHTHALTKSVYSPVDKVQKHFRVVWDSEERIFCGWICHR